MELDKAGKGLAELWVSVNMSEVPPFQSWSRDMLKSLGFAVGCQECFLAELAK